MGERGHICGQGGRDSYEEAKRKLEEWKGNQWGRQSGSQQVDQGGQARKKKEAEGRKPPPLEHSLLSTLKRAPPSCRRVTREELPPSPAGREKQTTGRQEAESNERRRALTSPVCFLQPLIYLRGHVMLEERVKPHLPTRLSNCPPQEMEE